MINFRVELGYSCWWLTVLLRSPMLRSGIFNWNQHSNIDWEGSEICDWTICCLDLKFNPCTVDPCIHQYHGGSTRRVRGTYWSTIGKQWKRTTVCFFRQSPKGPGRDLKSLTGKFGVHHYQKIVPQNGQVEDIQIGKIFGQLAQTQSLLHVPFEGALNIARPRSLKRWFSHLLVVMFIWGTFLASARLFFSLQ